MFKAGDIVKCIDPLGYLEMNKIYVVTSRLSKTLINVQSLETGKTYEGYYDERFENGKSSNKFNYL